MNEHVVALLLDEVGDDEHLRGSVESLVVAAEDESIGKHCGGGESPVPNEAFPIEVRDREHTNRFSEGAGPGSTLVHGREFVRVDGDGVRTGEENRSEPGNEDIPYSEVSVNPRNTVAPQVPGERSGDKELCPQEFPHSFRYRSAKPPRITGEETKEAYQRVGRVWTANFPVAVRGVGPRADLR